MIEALCLSGASPKRCGPSGRLPDRHHRSPGAEPQRAVLTVIAGGPVTRLPVHGYWRPTTRTVPHVALLRSPTARDDLGWLIEPRRSSCPATSGEVGPDPRRMVERSSGDRHQPGERYPPRRSVLPFRDPGVMSQRRPGHRGIINDIEATDSRGLLQRPSHPRHSSASSKPCSAALTACSRLDLLLQCTSA